MRRLINRPLNSGSVFNRIGRRLARIFYSEDRQKNQELAQLHYRLTILKNDIDYLEEDNSVLDQFRVEDDMNEECCHRFSGIATASRSGIDIGTVADMYEMNSSEIELVEELCNQRLYGSTR